MYGNHASITFQVLNEVGAAWFSSHCHYGSEYKEHIHPIPTSILRRPTLTVAFALPMLYADDLLQSHPQPQPPGRSSTPTRHAQHPISQAQQAAL